MIPTAVRPPFHFGGHELCLLPGGERDEGSPGEMFLLLVQGGVEVESERGASASRSRVGHAVGRQGPVSVDLDLPVCALLLRDRVRVVPVAGVEDLVVAERIDPGPVDQALEVVIDGQFGEAAGVSGGARSAR